MPPRIFIIASHGSMPMQEDKSLGSLPIMGKAKLKRVVEFKTPVDIFTTASFGSSFVGDLRCDEPFVDFVREFNSHRAEMKTQPTKPQLRKLIEDVMVHSRGLPQQADVLRQGKNKIRCHKKDCRMTELFLFGADPAVPVIESVTMLDVETGDIQDVHREFGLVKKKKIDAIPTMLPHHPKALAILQDAKTSATSELAALKAQNAHPHFIAMKTDRIQSINDTIACVHKQSKFEYSAKMKKRFKMNRIKLSDLLQVGMSGESKGGGGLINPETDFVIVYACRVPDDGVLGAQTSPRDSNDSASSVGGTRFKQRRNQRRSKTRKRCSAGGNAANNF